MATRSDIVSYTFSTADGLTGLAHRHIGPPAYVAHRHPAQSAAIDLVFGNEVQQRLERDAALHSRQRRAQAAVHAVPEREVETHLALPVDVEPIGIGEHSFIARCRPSD